MEKENRLPYQRIAVCGYRQKGRELCRKLLEAGIEVPYIIERNYQALTFLEQGLKIEIVGFQKEPDYYRQAEVILMTGDLPEGVIRECLELAGIDVPVITDIEV